MSFEKFLKPLRYFLFSMKKEREQKKRRNQMYTNGKKGNTVTVLHCHCICYIKLDKEKK